MTPAAEVAKMREIVNKVRAYGREKGARAYKRRHDKEIRIISGRKG